MFFDPYYPTAFRILVKSDGTWTLQAKAEKPAASFKSGWKDVPVVYEAENPAEPDRTNG